MIHLGTLFARLARRHAAMVAVVDEAGRAWTWQEWGARLNRVGNALLGLGLVPGERVALLLPDGRAYLEAEHGAMAAGLVRVPIDPRLPRADVLALLRHAGAAALVTDATLAHTSEGLAQDVEGLRHVIAVGGGIGGAVSWEPLLDAASDALPNAPREPDALASLNFSGGTTGAPKAVMLLHRNIAAALQHAIAGFGVAPGEVFLNLRPLWPVAQLVATAHLAGGATLVLGGRFEPETFADTLAASGATCTSLVPTHLARLIEHLAPGDARLARLRAIQVGGSRLPPDAFGALLDRIGPRIGILYGLTEAPISCMLPPVELDVPEPERTARMGRVGFEAFGTELRLDPASGEVLIRGPQVMAGYWRDEAATAAALRQGWLHTGDLGAFDDAGRLAIVGRLKEVIRTGAMSVVPAEVEDALARHPAVAEVAVVGLPDAVWGEAVTAFVVLRSGAAVGEPELIDHCRGLLAGPKRPKTVRFVAAIPRSHYGKVLRAQLLADAVS